MDRRGEKAGEEAKHQSALGPLPGLMIQLEGKKSQRDRAKSDGCQIERVFGGGEWVKNVEGIKKYKLLVIKIVTVMKVQHRECHQ